MQHNIEDFQSKHSLTQSVLLQFMIRAVDLPITCIHVVTSQHTRLVQTNININSSYMYNTFNKQLLFVPFLLIV